VAVNPGIGKLLYGALFVLLLPMALVIWATGTRGIIPLPVPPIPWIGGVVAAIGIALMLGGMWALWVHGRGLPMSPYPPSAYVSAGPYRYVSHPIYLGFGLLCAGASILARSPSGLWLITPAMALGCAALVLGYEGHDLRQRFGEATLEAPLIRIPPASDSPPRAWDRISVVLLVLLPWAVAFEAVYFLGVPADTVQAYLPFERDWPVLEWTEAVYGSAYALVLGSLFVAPTRSALRRFSVLGLLATCVVIPFYLLAPIISPPRPFQATSPLGLALMGERAMAHTVAAFPAFHLIWTLIAAEGWASRSRRLALIAWVWAILIGVSCVTTGMHALADLAAAVLVFLLLQRYRRLWEATRRLAEKLANSWREWRLGPVRIIVHGAYAGLAGATGLAVAMAFAGPAAFWSLTVVFLAGLVGAGLLAQGLEGSSRLSRPFGYFGSIIGALAGCFIVGSIRGNTMLLLGSVALGAPWMQAIGRLRCLVQGCCHGSPASEATGIRYRHPRSRVLTLGGLGGAPLHPTPLYSLLSNLVMGAILVRLWWLGSHLSLVAGSYLILAGVTRFVEESYRGEPQTPIVGGLRVYQWFAVGSFVVGAAMTTIPSPVTPGLALWLDPRVLAASLGYGACAAFAMGVDFPGSSRRFARLADP